MMRLTIVAALAAASLATPALAGDPTGYRQIAAGDLAGAERALLAERRIFPARPELMLNLAAVYARTGRAAEAGELYRAALAAPAVALEMPSGKVVSSHALATAGLARDGVEVAGR